MYPTSRVFPALLLFLGCSGGLLREDRTVGPEGGRVAVEGARLEIPSGSLLSPVHFSVELVEPSADDELTFQPIGEEYEIGPSGTLFAVPATIELPLDPTQISAGEESEVRIFTRQGDGPWEVLLDVAEPQGDGVVRAEVHHLSRFRTGLILCGVQRDGGTRPFCNTTRDAGTNATTRDAGSSTGTRDAGTATVARDGGSNTGTWDAGSMRDGGSNTGTGDAGSMRDGGSNTGTWDAGSMRDGGSNTGTWDAGSMRDGGSNTARDAGPSP